MRTIDPIKAVKRADELFHSGWNCAESVFVAIHEQAGEGEAPVQLLTALGGGMGCKRTCGALSGATVALGIAYGRRNSRRGGQENRIRQSPRTLQGISRATPLHRLLGINQRLRQRTGPEARMYGVGADGGGPGVRPDSATKRLMVAVVHGHSIATIPDGRVRPSGRVACPGPEFRPRR